MKRKTHHRKPKNGNNINIQIKLCRQAKLKESYLFQFIIAYYCYYFKQKKKWKLRVFCLYF